VSDGLDRTISAVLARHGLELPYFANNLQWRGEDRWRLGFPNARSDCVTLSGNCKCQFADMPGSQLRIVIGDGRSDFCLAGRADLVLAKQSLLSHCRKSGLPHYAFENFSEAADLLAGWLQQRVEVATDQRAHVAEE
jgi:2-hydroxy-3-keto-5-methylthiopentenyl-1-phosphate phosphatase